MATWIKWWKDKTFIKIWIVIMITMIIGFLLAYFINFGWIVTIVVSCIGGFIIRKIITNKLDEISNTL